MAARNFPTFATNPTDSGAGTLDAKEYADLVASNGNFALENTAVTVAHTGGGSANAIATTTTPAITAYAADQTFWLVPTADNTGAVTIVRDGLATRAVVDKAGDALVGGELVTGNAYLMWDNGTHIRIMTPDASGGGSSASLTKIVDAVSLSGASYALTDFDYDEAYIFMDDAEPSGTNVALRLRLSDDNGATDEVTGYTHWSGSETTFMNLYDGNAWDNGTPGGFYIHILRIGTEILIDGYSYLGSDRNVCIFDNGNDVDALKIYPSSGTFSGGAITIWAK